MSEQGSQNRHSTPPEKPHEQKRGFSMVELLIGLAIFAVVMGVSLRLLLSGQHLRAETEEHYEADLLLANTAGYLKSLSPTVAYSLYHPNTSGDAFPAPGSGAGSEFLSSFLEQLSGLDQASVKVEFLTDESTLQASYGTQLDLDGDGFFTTTNVATDSDGDGLLDAKLLPVLLEVTWSGRDNVARTRRLASMIVTH